MIEEIIARPVRPGPVADEIVQLGAKPDAFCKKESHKQDHKHGALGKLPACPAAVRSELESSTDCSEFRIAFRVFGPMKLNSDATAEGARSA